MKQKSLVVLVLGTLILLFSNLLNTMEYPKSIPAITKETQNEPISIISTKKAHPDVLIYCTHYWESYLPDLNRKSYSIKTANDKIKNVTLVGKKLMKALQKESIGSLFVSQSYTSTNAYHKSNKMITTALGKQKEDIPYLIDIHRDSIKRSKSTSTIGNLMVARMLFVIGSSSVYYKENLNFANYLHTKINKKYPGLSRGVVIKKATNQANGEYNQSFSPRCLLLEIGGYENSFEEAYRSVSILAQILGEKIKKESLYDPDTLFMEEDKIY